MKTRVAIACILGLSVAICSSGARAAGESDVKIVQGPKTIHVTGCPSKGVEASCLMLISKNQTYDITSAPAQVDPAHPQGPPSRPRVGYLGISLDGTVAEDAVGICMQGTILKDIKWSYTRQKCDQAKSITEADKKKLAQSQTQAGPKCTWQATHDFMPPGPARLIIAGTCEMPTPGYQLTLVRAIPQGINPRNLVVTLKVQPPSGIVSQVVTPTEARYEEKTNEHYDFADILPRGVSVPVREVH